MSDDNSQVYASSTMTKMFKNPKFIFATLGFYVGMGLLILGERDISLPELFQRYGVTSLGIIILIISVFVMSSGIFQFKKEARFSDIDEKRKFPTDDIAIERLAREIESLKGATTEIDYQKIASLVKESTIAEKNIQSEKLKSFEAYFDGIRRTLEDKASIADEKASILLDKGTAYSKGGITFFIISIAVWQTLSWLVGFQTQYIYGIASCSVLFIFIEFLSAWFLKQYRQFIDTSTYLIKVKSIFDKYMLSYLVLKEASGEDKEKLREMIGLLKEDIKWPESYLLKDGDVSFAKETMETMTYLLKSLKETVKEK